MWDSSQSFYYDPKSTITASATKWGGVHDGSHTYGGIKAVRDGLNALEAEPLAFPLAEQFESYGEMVAYMRLSEFLAGVHGEVDASFSELYKGIAKWASGTNPNIVVIAIGVIAGALVLKGYRVRNVRRPLPGGGEEVNFYFGPANAATAVDGVPPNVVADWKAALLKAKQYNPIDGGVFLNK